MSRPGKLEQEARAKLAEARRGPALVPDRWGRDDDTGERFGFVSAAAVELAAGERLEAVGLHVECVAIEQAGAIVRTVWTWGTAQWRSPDRRVDVPLGPLTPARIPATQTAGAVALARKLYLRQLLELRTAEDVELELARAMDFARESAATACQRALDAWAKKHRTSADTVLRTLTGIDPGPSVEVRLTHLAPPAVAEVWRWLLWRSNGASEQVDLGTAPAGVDDLPAELGGPA